MLGGSDAHGCWGGRSGQDLGDGVWPLLAALLPRTAKLQAPTPPAPHVRAPARLPACALMRVAALQMW